MDDDENSLLYKYFSWIISALDSATAYSPVTISSVQVPQYGVYGEHAVLWCKYTSVQPVYSVRWYKNGKEFFRYVININIIIIIISNIIVLSYLPGKASPITVHNLSGIHVEMSKSNMNYVTLSPLTLASTGRYRFVSSCHIPDNTNTSSIPGARLVRKGQCLPQTVPMVICWWLSLRNKGPSFMAQSQGNSVIYFLTTFCIKVPPISISVDVYFRYFLGEKLSINCTSAATLPPANLTLYINQKLVSYSGKTW